MVRVLIWSLVRPVRHRRRWRLVCPKAPPASPDHLTAKNITISVVLSLNRPAASWRARPKPASSPQAHPGPPRFVTPVRTVGSQWQASRPWPKILDKRLSMNHLLDRITLDPAICHGQTLHPRPPLPGGDDIGTTQFRDDSRGSLGRLPGLGTRGPSGGNYEWRTVKPRSGVSSQHWLLKPLRLQFRAVANRCAFLVDAQLPKRSQFWLNS